MKLTPTQQAAIDAIKDGPQTQTFAYGTDKAPGQSPPLELRAFHEPIKAQIEKHFEDGRRHVLYQDQLGTGSRAVLMAVVAGHAGRVLVVAPAQIHAYLRDMAASLTSDSEVGELASEARIVVTTPMKLAQHLAKADAAEANAGAWMLSGFDLMAVEEHHPTQKRWLQPLLERFRGKTLEISRCPDSGFLIQPDAAVFGPTMTGNLPPPAPSF